VAAVVAAAWAAWAAWATWTCKSRARPGIGLRQRGPVPVSCKCKARLRAGLCLVGAPPAHGVIRPGTWPPDRLGQSAVPRERVSAWRDHRFPGEHLPALVAVSDGMADCRRTRLPPPLAPVNGAWWRGLVGGRSCRANPGFRHSRGSSSHHRRLAGGRPPVGCCVPATGQDGTIAAYKPPALSTPCPDPCLPVRAGEWPSAVRCRTHPA
jgi:hypothetical protein